MTFELFPINAFNKHPLFSMQKEMSRLFNELGGTPTESKSNFLTPKLDIHEEAKLYDIAVELPGVDPKDVIVNLKDGLLSIKGEKKYKKEENREGQKYVERSYGSFERTLRLPENIKEDSIDASFKSGVLHIQVPKLEVNQAEEKKIEIRPE